MLFTTRSSRRDRLYREPRSMGYSVNSAECNSHPTQRINDAVEIRIRESQDESLFDLRCPPPPREIQSALVSSDPIADAYWMLHYVLTNKSIAFKSDQRGKNQEMGRSSFRFPFAGIEGDNIILCCCYELCDTRCRNHCSQPERTRLIVFI